MGSFFAEEAGSGDVPSAAEERLTGAGDQGIAFTSSLSVPEFALLGGVEAVPLAQVLGAAVYHVGWQYLPLEAQWGGEVFCELEQLSGAWDEARRLAFDRLAHEAALVGADAVVGVRLKRGEHDWARGTVDYVVSGTAIRTPARDRERSPVLSDLSVQEYWKLREAGWGPAGLVAAAAVFFIAQSNRAKWWRRATVARNQELTEFSRGLSAARKEAVRYLRGQASAVGASGIVGVTLRHRLTPDRIRVALGRVRPTGAGLGTIALGAGYQAPQGQDKRDGMIVTVHAVGTAIRRARDRTPPTLRPIVRLGAPS